MVAASSKSPICAVPAPPAGGPPAATPPGTSGAGASAVISPSCRTRLPGGGAIRTGSSQEMNSKSLTLSPLRRDRARRGAPRELFLGQAHVVRRLVATQHSTVDGVIEAAEGRFVSGDTDAGRRSRT